MFMLNESALWLVWVPLRLSKTCKLMDFKRNISKGKEIHFLTY